MLSSAKMKIKPSPDMYDQKQGGPKGISWVFHDDQV